MSTFPSQHATCILPVKDMPRARAFYGDRLGLEVVGGKPDGKFVYRCGGTEIALFPKPEGTKAQHTALSFRVDRIDEAVSALKARGVPSDQIIRQMDPRIFLPEPMGLRASVLELPLASRFFYDADQSVFFIDFENLHIRQAEQISQIREIIQGMLAPLGRKVPAVVNYHGFDILDELIDTYATMIEGLMADFYSEVTRYATNTFLRAKLGDALTARRLAPHIFDSAEEAYAKLDESHG